MTAKSFFFKFWFGIFKTFYDVLKIIYAVGVRTNQYSRNRSWAKASSPKNDRNIFVYTFPEPNSIKYLKL
jgi:hypothetical protein